LTANTQTFRRLYGCLCSITIKRKQREPLELTA
jgi:hypothetical protein